MASDKDGGPAFPTFKGANLVATGGMSLRDWFAGQAIYAAARAAATANDKSAKTVAAFAYEIADAMLAARAGDKEK